MRLRLGWGTDVLSVLLVGWIAVSAGGFEVSIVGAELWWRLGSERDHAGSSGLQKLGLPECFGKGVAPWMSCRHIVIA